MLIRRLTEEVAVLGMLRPRAFDMTPHMRLGDRHQHRWKGDHTQAVASEPLTPALQLALPHHALAGWTGGEPRIAPESAPQRLVLHLQQHLPVLGPATTN
jgi:hypothetical protein